MIEPGGPLKFGEVLSHLKETDTPLSSTELAELSDLARGELAAFLKMWQTLPGKRRRDIINRLSELAEENLELDYIKIFRHLLRDGDSGVRVRAIQGLWESEDASLTTPLTRLLKEDPSSEAQAAAATALGKFAMLTEQKKLGSACAETISRTLLDTVNDATKPIEVRRRALEAVSPVSLPEVTRAITAAYQSRDAKFRTSAIYAMGRSCNTAFMSILKRELGNPEAETRYEAATALGEMGEEEAVIYLAEHLEDPDIDVRMAAIRALGRIGGAQARRYLRQYLKSEVGAVVEAVAEALEELEGGESPLNFRR